MIGLNGIKISQLELMNLTNQLLVAGVPRERVMAMVVACGEGPEYLAKAPAKAHPTMLDSLLFIGVGLWAIVYFFYLLHVGFAETTFRQWCALGLLCILSSRMKKSILGD